jgi:hypothetical protein
MVSRWTGYTGPSDRGKVVETYYVWIAKQKLRSPAEDGSYGSLQECFEALVEEVYG